MSTISLRRGSRRVRSHLVSERRRLSELKDVELTAQRPGARVSMSVSLPQIDAAMRPIYQEDTRHSARASRLQARQRQEIATRAKNVEAAGAKGLWVMIGAAVLCVLLLCLWLPGRLQVAEANARVRRLRSQITEAEAECEALTAEYEALVEDQNLGLQAVEIGMISSKGVAPIELRVPEGAVLEPFQEQ